MIGVNDQKISEDFSMLLLRWYDLNARVLPWREEPTPYRVWVSEIMLQQTQVVTVLSYFQRFMTALPDIAALAQVEEAVLFKLWEGLGYYNRARNLQRAAQLVVRDFGGQLPEQYEYLLALPGIGEYTAGAIASIAYGQALPAVDGNVLRVMARVLACDDDIAEAKTKKQFRTMLEKILPDKRAGDFNQSLMELGARVCLPKKKPLCGECPIQACCQGWSLGVVDQLPVKTRKKARKIQQKTILLIIAEGKVLLRQRAAKGLLAGMWEFPSLEGWLTEQELFAFLSRRQSTDHIKLTALVDTKHIFTHLEWQMQGWLLELSTKEILKEGVWASLAEIRKNYAIPSAYKSYTEQLTDWLD